MRSYAAQLSQIGAPVYDNGWSNVFRATITSLVTYVLIHSSRETPGKRDEKAARQQVAPRKSSFKIHPLPLQYTRCA